MSAVTTFHVYNNVIQSHVIWRAPLVSILIPRNTTEEKIMHIKSQDYWHFIVILILQRKEFSSRLRHLDICCCSDHRLNLSVFRGQSVRNLRENVIPKLILYQVGMFLNEKQRQFRESLFVMRFLVEDFVNNLQYLLRIDIKTGFIKQGNQEPLQKRSIRY